MKDNRYPFAMAIRRRGVSLVEILIGLIIVVVASLATLTYFSSALGNVGRQSNRRAALERARERLERLMEVDVNSIQPVVIAALPQNAQPVRWVKCVGATCGPELLSPDPTDQVNVDDLTGQTIESTIQWKDDPSALTSTPDVLELVVKVWFVPGPLIEDDFHRVHIRTLRTP